MNGIWILLFLLFIAALPVIIVFLWFRAVKSPVTLPWLLLSLSAGVLSLVPAAIIQNFFPYSARDGLGQVFFGVFIRIALVEEAGRLITLIPLLKAAARRRPRSVAAGLNQNASEFPGNSALDSIFAAGVGLAAGLGFAAIENALYGTADIKITFLRAFTAAPLHGACAVRAALAVFFFRQRPAKALFLFASAVLIHGAYNLMIVSPALPSLLAVPAAYSALFATLPYLKAGDVRN